jgi:hypothetical protein
MREMESKYNPFRPANAAQLDISDYNVDVSDLYES